MLRGFIKDVRRFCEWAANGASQGGYSRQMKTAHTEGNRMDVGEFSALEVGEFSVVEPMSLKSARMLYANKSSRARSPMNAGWVTNG